jgi:hypothetical protein
MTDGCNPPPYYVSLNDRVRVTEMLELIVTYFPYVVKINVKDDLSNQAQAMLWCVAQYGEGGRVRHLHRGEKVQRPYLNPHASWAQTRMHFAFKNPDHAFEFKMRWG